MIDALASLVAKSMIGAERAGGTTRYQLLETLRHFAREQAGDLDGLRRRHAAHYAAFAEQAGAGLLSRDELVWRPRLGGRARQPPRRGRLGVRRRRPRRRRASVSGCSTRWCSRR